MELTNMEIEVIKAYKVDEYVGGNWEEPGECTWSWTFFDCGCFETMRKDQFPGVLSSLVKKGIMWQNGAKGEDAAFGLTDLGINVAGMVDEL